MLYKYDHMFAQELIDLYSFVGCTVAPGFDFADFELADQVAMVGRFPQYLGVIERLA